MLFIVKPLSPSLSSSPSIHLLIAQDEVASPYSLAFSLDGDRLYTGFNKFIKVFNTSRPGRDCTTIRTYG